MVKTPVLVIHGPNLNLLGTREPAIYGTLSLEQINTCILELGNELDLELKIIQSNHEGEIIDAIHSAQGVYEWIVMNPGAFTHYSYGIRDAIAGAAVPTIEVHLSNLHNREEFRKNSVTASVCVGQISGFGYVSYLLALQAIKGQRKAHKGDGYVG